MDSLLSGLICSSVMLMELLFKILTNPVTFKISWAPGHVLLGLPQLCVVIIVGPRYVV